MRQLQLEPIESSSKIHLKIGNKSEQHATHDVLSTESYWQTAIWLARFRLSIRSYVKEANILQISRDNFHSNIYPP